MTMSMDRYMKLQLQGGKLTEKEMRAGWHFCPDWDEMLTQVCDRDEEGECHDETHRLRPKDGVDIDAIHRRGAA